MHITVGEVTLPRVRVGQHVLQLTAMHAVAAGFPHMLAPSLPQSFNDMLARMRADHTTPELVESEQAAGSKHSSPGLDSKTVHFAVS